MISENLAENYVMKFGKFKGMKLVDILKIVTVDKNGNEKLTGLLYLQWLINQEWFKHKDLVKNVIQSISDEEESEKEQEPQPPKPKPKPKKKEKKVKVGIVEEDNKILNFEN